MSSEICLYFYRCESCNHSEHNHLPGDTHDGEAAACSRCGGAVMLEWDGGVTFEVQLPGGPVKSP